MKNTRFRQHLGIGENILARWPTYRQFGEGKLQRHVGTYTDLSRRCNEETRTWH